MSTIHRFRSLVGVVTLALPAAASGQLSLSFERVASGLSSPVFATYAPGDTERLFIVQRGGAIRILNLDTDTLNGANFIQIPGVDSGGQEKGLLGLAFHPDYQASGLFYVNFTDNTSGDTRIMQFSRLTADIADPTSGVNVLEIHQPQINHNGGWIGFGPNGYLYIATGDGGNANDTGTGHTAGTGNAQDITNNLLGKMLRIDVNGDDFLGDPTRNYAIPPDNPFVDITGDDEIFLYGLRNPWRCSFDRLTSDLYIGDVGEGAREEINVMYAGSMGGQNYGWRLREGMIATPTGGVGGPPPEGNVNPVYDYLHTNLAFGGFCITGGYVYRGPVQDLCDHYFFADYVSNRVWSFRFDQSSESEFDGTNYTDLINWTNILDTDIGTINSISSFGEDTVGNLYICDLTGGELFRLVSGNASCPPPTTTTPDDFNAFRGFYNSGDLDNLLESDDSDLCYEPGIVLGPSEAPVTLDFFGTLPNDSPSTLDVTIESSANTVGLELTFSFWNVNTNSWDIVGTDTQSLNEDTVRTFAGNPADHVEAGTGEVRTRYEVRVVSFIFLFPWLDCVDHVFWTTTN